MTQIVVAFPDYPALTLANDNYDEGFSLVDVLNWFDGPDVRPLADARPDSDGDFEQDAVYSDARYPIVVGQVRYADESQFFAARRIVAALWARRNAFDMQVTSPEGTHTARVIRNGKPTWDLWVGPGHAEFRLPLKAEDPRKYGPLKSVPTGLPVSGGGVESPVVSPFSQIGGGSPGRVMLTNEGTTDTLPILRVSGGGMTGGVEILRIDTAQLLRLEWPILATDVIEFDTATGQVWLNGQSPIAGYLTKSDWWTLGAGESTTLQFSSLGVVTGTPTLTAEWRDADS